MRTYEGQIGKPQINQIFVFGSNTEGRHGKGAALCAKQKWGAIQNQPKGLQGRSYAIITKNLRTWDHPSIPKYVIMEQIDELYKIAYRNPRMDFLITYSGTGDNLNWYSNIELAEMFKREYIPENIVFAEEFAKLIQSI